MNAVRTYEPPGPGGWEIDPTHFPRPPSPIHLQLYTTTFVDGLAAGFEAMGSVMDRLDMRASGGFVYTQPRVVGAPAGSAPPPTPILWLFSRLHPALRKRARRASEVFATRAWREEARRFEEVDKPELIRRHRALLGVRVTSLDDGALAAYLREAHEGLRHATWVHGRYTVPCQLPMGDYVAHVTRWTGRAPNEVLAVIAGHAPASAGWTPELEALVAALRDHSVDAIADEDADPAEALATLQNDPVVGTLARAWVEIVGWRTVAAYDIAEPVALELPMLLLGTLRAALAGRLRPARAPDEQVSALREAVPAEHRAEFDALLDEARAMSALRDERTLYADYWACGILRRAVLEAGRRLEATRKVRRASDLCAATLDEMVGLLGGATEPTADELASRAAERGRYFTEAPAAIGTVHAPPPSTALPEPLGRGLAAALAVLDAMFGDAPVGEPGEDVRGIPVSAGVVDGVARIVDSRDDFHRLRPGDVLVATMTSPVYNVVLPMLGGIVTDRGGALSHAAIVSREFGIPGVVGCRDATKRLRDGDLVRVDGGTGVVKVLGRRG